ncbi:MAG TPA: DUF1015 domain-containing protein [Dehalococcoidia bacterium]|nr:DUF1015 domain-containing protein [Dehalococcoidia bacterium]
MADVRPFRALRYSPAVDLATAICPPYDIISPHEQDALYDRSPHNAVRLELARGEGDERYANAARALSGWVREGTLRRDEAPTFYLYRQSFRHEGRTHHRHILFARLRLEEWGRGVVLPHERTFGAPKEDRLRLLRAARLQTSPVYLLYRDSQARIRPVLEEAAGRAPFASFASPDGQQHALWRIDEPDANQALADAFRPETLYVADGHHRYETALAYRDERRAAAREWTDDEPENFVLAALTAAGDPGLLVLPIHRLINAGGPLSVALERLGQLFDVEVAPSSATLPADLTERGRLAPAFGLAAAGSPDAYLLSLRDRAAVDRVLPAETSPTWRALDSTIADYAVIRHALGLTEAQTSDIDTLWFSEDAEEALAAVRAARARYAVLLNPVPVARILAVADAGERMPQKSTYFYPKVPTGLVFNPLDE